MSAGQQTTLCPKCGMTIKREEIGEHKAMGECIPKDFTGAMTPEDFARNDEAEALKEMELDDE